ncbi:MAG: hypothetical protein K2F94_08440 [Muribaculaceae bacterium]|nr:hypothetical protein [Muribaculaceae bacterium]
MKRALFYGYLVSNIALTAGITSCSSLEEDKIIPSGERHGPKQIELTQETRSTAQDLNDFYFRFTTDMTKHIDSESNGDKNVIVSPLSAAMTLGMVANGIDDTSKKAITDYLGTENIAALNSLCQTLLSELPVTDNLTNLMMANSFWLNHDMNISLEDNFASTIKVFYGSETGCLNFSSDPANSLNTINSWCYSNTNGLIPEYFKEIDPNIFAIALNAMYFNAPWDGSLFSADDTKSDIFQGAAGDSDILMMHMAEKPTPYAANDTFEYFSLPLGNSTFHMRVILPKNGVSLSQATELIDGKLISLLKKESEYVTLTLDFPKFNTEESYSLSDMFDKIGLKYLSSESKLTMFNSETIGDVTFHQATSFNVDEKGAEMAAVSSGEIYDSAAVAQKAVSVKADRPFFFFIEEFSTGACILSGRIADL